MKTSKSPKNKEITPSKKKLTQARLPFKLISEVSPKPAAPQVRKRKLSIPDVEPVSKVGKICKENDLDKDLVVISDEDSKDGEKPQNEVKQHNPFVKLVDTAWKKKLQKKTPKKRNKTKSAKKVKAAQASEPEVCDDNDVEMVEVDVLIHTEDSDINGTDDKNDTDDKTALSPKPVENTTDNEEKVTTPEEIANEEISEISVGKQKDVVCLEDSDDKMECEDAKSSQNESQETDNAVSKDVKTDDSNKESSNNNIEAKPVNQVTPKRSTRNKAKTEEKMLNTSKSSSKLDDSVCSDPTTPKHNRSITNSDGDKSMNDSTAAANLTPKQLQKRLESAKKKEEREKEKQERELKRQQEKDERAKQRQEKEEQKKREREEKEEAKRREKEEKEEQRKKEREEKERQKETEKKVREMKEELKRKEKEDKEEQRKKEKEVREEEKRKRQEALELEKQEQELKKKKAAEAFANFFVPKQKIEKDQVVGPVSKNNMLSSFTIKVDMRLAPTIRVDLSEERRETLEKCLEKQNSPKSNLYLKCLREGTSKPISSGKTWPLSDKDNDDDVMIVEDELPPIDGAGEIITCESAAREKLRPKLFSFHENRRPPYWGTWRKKSAFVKPRRPFGQEKQLDYEVDSDDDWEDEQDGESLDGSACGSDEEDARGDDYEVDNEVFVPHGYLSDEEATMEEDDVLSLTPETQKQRLKHLEDEFESEMKKPTEKLKPRMYGILWESKDGGRPENCVEALWNYFEKYAMIMDDITPLLQPANEPEEVEKKKVKKKKAVTEGDEQSPKPEKKKKAKTETKESKKPKTEVKKTVPNQPGINSFLKKINT